MRNKPKTVQQLAREAAFDMDEVYLTLWEMGFEDITNPTDTIAARNVKVVKKALGITTRKQIKSISYWA